MLFGTKIVSLVLYVEKFLQKQETNEYWVLSSIFFFFNNLQRFSIYIISSIEKDGQPWCEPCYDKKFGEICGGCGKIIPATASIVKALAQTWVN